MFSLSDGGDPIAYFFENFFKDFTKLIGSLGNFVFVSNLPCRYLNQLKVIPEWNFPEIYQNATYGDVESTYIFLSNQ